MNKCDIGSWLKDANVLKKTSASDSAVILGRFLTPSNILISNGIVVKLSFAAKKTSKDNSLETEICIYSKVMNQLVKNHITPNVITYIGSFQCPNFYQQLDNNKYPFLKDVLKQMENIENDNMGKGDTYDFNTAQVLIIERGTGGPLIDNFNNYIIEEWRSILFQTLYTFYIFSIIGLKHNDNHLGNIWIDKVEKRTATYIVDSNHFRIPVTNLVKIFDFDLSYFKGCPKNLKIYYNFCKKYGMCNDNNTKFDVFIFLCGIYSHFLMQNNTPAKIFVINFIESVIDKKLLNTKWDFHCRMCSFDKKHECRGPYTPSDKEMIPVFKMLGNDIFLPYLNNKQPVDPNFVYDPTPLFGKTPST